MRNGVLVAKLCGIDCDALSEWRGAAIAVLGSDLPSLPAGEFYWRDLVGLEVANGDGVNLGRVAHVFRPAPTIFWKSPRPRWRTIPPPKSRRRV